MQIKKDFELGKVISNQGFDIRDFQFRFFFSLTVLRASVVKQNSYLVSQFC